MNGWNFKTFKITDLGLKILSQQSSFARGVTIL